ncbi:hypothetical protein ACFV3R_08530 [Streptomyces sp. NPDC059740]|uniref:hypothetical protein n=1 Tax=Streptomyces sp. NPDC059740 TaxID=3346926 RepID=UPI0036473200
MTGRGTGAARTVRLLTALLGLASTAWGALLLSSVAEAWGAVRWLAGAVVLHDGVVAPLVLGAGTLLAGLREGPRAVVRGALLTGGCVTAVAAPVLLRPGRPANATVLPLDYPADWLLVLAAIAVCAAVLLVGSAARRRGRPTVRDREDG